MQGKVLFSNMGRNNIGLHEKITHWKVRTSQERLNIFPCCTEIILSKENFDASATQVSFKSKISSYLELLLCKACSLFSCEKHGTAGTKCFDPKPFSIGYITKVFACCK